MNTTKAEQIAEDAVRKMDNNYGPGALNRKDIILAALIQYATEQNKELVEALKKIHDVWGKQSGRVFESMGSDSPRALAIDAAIQDAALAALLAQHSEKGEK